MMFRFDSQFENERRFFAFVMLVIVTQNCVLLLNDYHSLSREMCDEREMHMMKR